MDLLSFIRTADPMKVRVAERQRVEDEPRLLETTVERVVPLLPVAPAYASSELEASIDKLFDEGVSGDGQASTDKLFVQNSRGPKMLRVKSLSDHPLIKYCFNTLERATYAHMTNSTNLVAAWNEFLEKKK
nr:hypothetical protein [Tanacetum cinerariifolium]